MKPEDIFQAISEIDETLLLETETQRKLGKKRKRQKTLLYSLTVVMIVAIGTGIFFYHDNRSITVSPSKTVVSSEPSSSTPHSNSKGVFLSPSLPQDGAVIGSFKCPSFWFEGREYQSMVSVPFSQALQGFYVGEVEILLSDIGSPEDSASILEKKDSSTIGNIEGEFFEVPGYKPEFLLCMLEKQEDGNDGLLLFFSGSGRTFYTGKDLFQDSLCAKGRISKVWLEVEKEISEYETEKVSIPIQQDFSPFLEALCEAPAVPQSQIPTEPPEGILFVALEDGVEFRLELYRGGYVVFSGIDGVAFQMDASIFNNWLQYCQ